ncbi:melibiose carrier protein [Oxobacter pfennigii]|uniref:Melibiose carrier protein n=1 Tax=Oxobacter pfennigii TaxID=36849 RepID=A0A0N8NSP1_9CLOT|nr:MFS transporter [Oxobacter pfennigii]KPU42576.1 melibiose carrier protein [Oxobacter pfennigii]
MKKPLSSALRNFYGIGDFGFSLMTSVELYLFVFFLTNVAKFSLPMVALIGAITSTGDAILSPFYGAIISGSKPMKWGRNRSWMLIGPPFVVVLYMFMYTKIGPEPVAAAIVCAGFILSHIAWNIGWVANMALIPVLANNPEERGYLAARRTMYTALAGAVYSYIGSPLAKAIGAATGNEIFGYSALAGIMALVMMIGYWTVFKMTEGYEETGAEAAAATGANKGGGISFGMMFKNAAQNPPLLVLLLGDFFRYMSNFIMTAAAAYFFTYVLNNMALMSLYLLIGSLAGVVSSYIAGRLSKVIPTRTATIMGLLVAGCVLIVMKFLGSNVVTFFVLVVVYRLVIGIAGAYVVAMYSDVAVYGEWKTGKNASPFVMGLMNLSLKAAVISRGTVIPFVLASAGFVAGVDPSQATDALKGAVTTVFFLIPGCLVIVCGLIWLFGYKLTKEKLAEYQAEIDKRKAQTA